MELDAAPLKLSESSVAVTSPPISLFALKALVMSFGLGVGDFLAIIHLSNQIWKNFDGAPSQFSDISALYVDNDNLTGMEAKLII
jgi:hypothetical protein